MSRSSIDRTPSRHRPPPWKWGWRTPLELQMLFAAGIAFAVLYLFNLLLPDTAAFARRILYVTLHEGGHAIAGIIQGVDVQSVAIRPDGSGEAAIATGDLAFSAAAGPIVPAWVAAILTAIGFTRASNSAVLLAMGIGLYLIAYMIADDPRVFWALAGFAALACVVGFAPAGPQIKSATMLVFAGMITLGVLDALPYLSIENVDRIVPALAMGEMMAEASTETNPSDVRIIATALHLDGIVEVRQVLIVLMLAGALLSILAITNFILRHRY